MSDRHKEDLKPDQIDELLSNLVSGVAIDEIVGETGYLHLDKPYPYLCVHRRISEDHINGVYRLLAGMGSVFLMPETVEEIDARIPWVHHIAAMLVDIFGAFLLVEVWPKKVTVPAETIEKEISFHIHTSDHGVEDTVLQALEEAILSHSWDGFTPRCNVSYEPSPAPNGLDSLASVVNVDNKRRFYIGIEVDAIYLEPETDTIRPEVLRSVGTNFSHCLKKAIFAFAQCKSTRKPQHYHQMGTQLFTESAVQSDTILTEIGKSVDLVLFATPVNTAQAWNIFQRTGYKKEPEFHYRPLTAHEGKLKRDLYNAPIDDIEDPALHFIFAERRIELDRQITMLSDRGKSDFLLGSQQIFPWPTLPLLEYAKALIKDIEPSSSLDAHEVFVTAETLADHAHEMLQSMEGEYSLEAKVHIRDDLPGIMVSNGNLLIGRDAKFSEKRVEAVLNHEIGTHILTHHNGAAQPFTSLQVGFAGYQALQEGLAVIAEYLSGGLSPNRLRQLAARVLAVHSVIHGATFLDTFHQLYSHYSFDAYAAFMTTMRAHRSGGFTKDIVYLQGVMEVLDLLAEGHQLEDLLVGKFAVSHVGIIEELRWREILRPCSILPPYLSDASARDKLNDLASGRSPIDLLGD